MSSFVQRLKELREESGLSLRELADSIREIGIVQPISTSLEKENPSAKFWKKFLVYLM